MHGFHHRLLDCIQLLQIGDARANRDLISVLLQELHSLFHVHWNGHGRNRKRATLLQFGLNERRDDFDYADIGFGKLQPKDHQYFAFKSAIRQFRTPPPPLFFFRKVTARSGRMSARRPLSRCRQEQTRKGPRQVQKKCASSRLWAWRGDEGGSDR